MFRRSRLFKRGFSFGQLLALTCCAGLLLGFYLGIQLVPRHWLGNLLGRQSAAWVLALHMPGSGVNLSELLKPQQNAQSYQAILMHHSGALNSVLPVTAEPEFPEQFNEPPPDAALPAPPQKEPHEGLPPELNFDLPLVALYCTHNAEAYAASEGVDKLEGKNAGVFQVAKTIESTLAEEKIGSVLCDTIHDYPSWAKSYANSLESITKMKEENPSLQVFVDVHRDVKPSGGTTVLKTDQGELAKIMLVVGSNKRLNHPNWEQNLAFSQKIGRRLEESCPGILRGVRVQDGRYNQHFSPYGILLEMGSTENTLDQAKRSGELIARVLAEVMREEAQLVEAAEAFAGENPEAAE